MKRAAAPQKTDNASGRPGARGGVSVFFFYFKLSWCGIAGYILILLGLIVGVAEEDLSAVAAGVVLGGILIVIHYVRYKTLNPFAPWAKDGSQSPPEPPKPPVPPTPPTPLTPPAPPVVKKADPPKSTTFRPLTPPPGRITDLTRLCPGCMNYLTEKRSVCPRCGCSVSLENHFPELSVRSLLAGKYMIGKCLGQGGFGITYLGWDLPGSRRVAIKEYYPSDCVNRQGDSYTVLPRRTEGVKEHFEKGRAKFYDEAQRLAKFQNVPGIVDVLDFFLENNTAYIVMEYIEGRTLRTYLDSLGRPMDLHDALWLLSPVVDSLETVHAAGMVHRDISPDNIMLTPSGEAKLLDFGAARDFSLQGERSNSIQVKMGYAPQEQYDTHGQQGPWTDEYALAATIYRCITGRVPEQCFERSSGVALTTPRSLGINLSPAQEKALLKGMALRHQDRYGSVREFYNALNV